METVTICVNSLIRAICASIENEKKLHTLKDEFWINGTYPAKPPNRYLMYAGFFCSVLAILLLIIFNHTVFYDYLLILHLLI